MKAFWTIAAAVGDGSEGNARRPDLDFGGEWHKVVAIGDLVVGKATAGAGNHRHLLSGTLLVPAADGHWHRVIKRQNGQIWQEMIDATGTVTDHNHTGDLWPDFYLVFVITTDQGATNIENNNGVKMIAPAAITGTSPTDPLLNAGDISDTVWTGAEQNWVNGKMNDWLGLTVPTVVDRPQRWVEWLLPISLTRVVQHERHFRFTS